MADFLVAGVSWKRIHTLGAIVFTIIGLAFGAGVQVALSKALIVDHTARLDSTDQKISVLEKSDTDKALHDAKRDAQWDELIKGISVMNATTARLGDKIDALGLQVARGNRR